MVLGKQFRDDQFTWLMQWAHCEIRKAKENTVRLNLVGVRNFEGLGALGRLGLRVYCYLCISTLFFSGSIHRLEDGGEVFHQVLQFPLR